jgi:HAD superfamily hydrolase (TIGR01484 family)
MYFFMTDTHEKLSQVFRMLHKMPEVEASFMNDSYSDDLWMLEVFSSQASKENAVRFIRKTYGFEKTVGFGDNLNDLPMFEACDVRVAVENAAAEVKAAADFICDTNNNGGVIKWLEENALC